MRNMVLRGRGILSEVKLHCMLDTRTVIIEVDARNYSKEVKEARKRVESKKVARVVVRIRKHSGQRPCRGGQDEIETAIGCIDCTDYTLYRVTV